MSRAFLAFVLSAALAGSSTTGGLMTAGQCDPPQGSPAQGLLVHGRPLVEAFDAWRSEMPVLSGAIDDGAWRLFRLVRVPCDRKALRTPAEPSVGAPKESDDAAQVMTPASTKRRWWVALIFAIATVIAFGFGLH